MSRDYGEIRCARVRMGEDLAREEDLTGLTFLEVIPDCKPSGVPIADRTMRHDVGSGERPDGKYAVIRIVSVKTLKRPTSPLADAEDATL